MSAWLSLQASLLAGYLAARVGRAGAREGRWILAASLVAPFVRLPAAAGEFVPAPPSVMEAVPRLGTAALTATAAAPHAPDLAVVIAAIGVARLLWAAWSLRRALRGGVLLHRIGRVRVYAVPGQHFAAWWGGPVVAVDPAWDRLALRHELRHHRHGDALRAWGLLLLGVVAEPMATLWRRWLAGEEELAVDRALVARGADPRAYARVLVAHAAPPYAPALARSLLHRRIQMLLSPTPRRSFALVLAAPLLALTLGASPPAAAPVPASVAGVAPVAEPLNELVADQLERYSNGEGKAWADGALARRDPSLRARIEAAGLPGWLEAVPFVESGFRPTIRSQYPTSGPSAGLWQFIPATARRYGLRVDDQLDERLDAGRSTDAAIAFLKDLYAWNRDWPLALASYNQGQDVVSAAIRKEGTRDAWELQRRGALNHYAAMVYAAAMLLQP